MSPAVPPLPEPDPSRADLATLEEKLRALAPPRVPTALESKLVASIPSAGAAGALATMIAKYWLWIAGTAGVCIVAGALVHWWPSGANFGGGQPGKATVENGNRPTSAALKKFEDAVSVEPYNAEAWFNLAKAQAEAHRPEDAVSSAQKAIDVARSRDRNDFAQNVEAWLKTYKAANHLQKSP